MQRIESEVDGSEGGGGKRNKLMRIHEKKRANKKDRKEKQR